MLKIIISGSSGHMGHNLVRLIAEEKDMEVVAGFDIQPVQYGDFPVFASPMDFDGEADAVIDFSNASALPGLLEFGLLRNIPLILCSTGYSESQIADIRSASEKLPIFRSGNMSLGINLLTELVKTACSVLGGKFDVEIVEKHHRRKVDAPSGTAIMLADAAASSLPYDAKYVYERESRREARGADEIGISSIRGGTIVGEHSVIFAGTDEVIEIKHSAFSRDVFAVGALNAARFISGQKAPGLYDMSDVINA